MHGTGVRSLESKRGFEQHGLTAAGGAQDNARFALAHFERKVLDRWDAVKGHAHMLELQNGLRAVRGHQGADASSPLVKMRVRKNVSTKISTDAITTAWVVALPTPCVPPVARRP